MECGLCGQSGGVHIWRLNKHWDAGSVEDSDWISLISLRISVFLCVLCILGLYTYIFPVWFLNMMMLRFCHVVKCRRCRRYRFDIWVGNIPWRIWLVSKFWRREKLPTPAFWPWEFHGLYNPWGHKESDRTEQPSLHFTSLNLELWPPEFYDNKVLLFLSHKLYGNLLQQQQKMNMNFGSDCKKYLKIRK